ncbi:hypothetical protein V8C44DRAFT_321265 [Trichoderma aethiopicum]
MDRVWSAVSSTTAACIAPASDLLQIYTQSLDENNRLSRIRYIQTAPVSRARDPSSNPSAPSALAPEKIPRGPGLIPGWDFPPSLAPARRFSNKDGTCPRVLLEPLSTFFGVSQMSTHLNSIADSEPRNLLQFYIMLHSFSQEYTSG